MKDVPWRAWPLKTCFLHPQWLNTPWLLRSKKMLALWRALIMYLYIQSQKQGKAPTPEGRANPYERTEFVTFDPRNTRCIGYTTARTSQGNMSDHAGWNCSSNEKIVVPTSWWQNPVVCISLCVQSSTYKLSLKIIFPRCKVVKSALKEFCNLEECYHTHSATHSARRLIKHGCT